MDFDMGCLFGGAVEASWQDGPRAAAKRASASSGLFARPLSFGHLFRGWRNPARVLLAARRGRVEAN